MQEFSYDSGPFNGVVSPRSDDNVLLSDDDAAIGMHDFEKPHDGDCEPAPAPAAAATLENAAPAVAPRMGRRGLIGKHKPTTSIFDEDPFAPSASPSPPRLTEPDQPLVGEFAGLNAASGSVPQPQSEGTAAPESSCEATFVPEPLVLKNSQRQPQRRSSALSRNGL